MGLPFAGSFSSYLLFFGKNFFFLQNTNVEEFEDNYISKNYREVTLKAARGNLLHQMVLFYNHQ